MTSIRQYPMVGGTSTTEGLVSYVVDGSWPPFLPFSAITNGQTVRFVATDGTQFEEGYGVKSSGGTLTRATILRTSAGDTDKIDWGTGTRTVYIVPDLDTVFEADDGTFVKMIKAPQVESDDAGEVTRRFRFWSQTGTMYLSDSTEAPFDHIISYNPAAATPRVEFDLPTDFLGGLFLDDVEIEGLASEADATTGTATGVLMSPLRVTQAIADPDLLIGDRTAASSAAYTDSVVSKTAAGLREMTLAQIDQLMNTPDYESLGNALNAGPVVKTHGLGSKPHRVRWALTCTATDAGHAVGDSITDLAWQTVNDRASGISVVVNATQIKFLFKDVHVVETDNSGPTLIDLAKWQVDIWAWIGGAAP